LTGERVIKDIGSLEDAAKVEETVKSGYCESIADSLNLWIAVEEDIADSYHRLAKKLDSATASKIEDLASRSGDTIKTLHKLSETLVELRNDRATRIRTLGELL